MVRITSAAYQRRPEPELEPVSEKFIKIIRLSTINEKMMKIPPRFVRLGPELSDSDDVSIETPTGVKYWIRIKRSGDEVWFEKGWSEFAEAHSISVGHLLFFHYKGNSSFLVVIFDKSALEIVDYPLNKVCVIESNNNDDDDDKVMEVVDDDNDDDKVMEVVDDDDDKVMEIVDDDDVIDLDELLEMKKPIVNIKSEKVTAITPSLQALSLSTTKLIKSESVSTTIVDVVEIDSMDEAEEI